MNEKFYCIIPLAILLLLSSMPSIPVVANPTPTLLDPNYTLKVFATGLDDGPFGMAFDKDGNLYVAGEGGANYPGHDIYKIDPYGQVSTFYYKKYLWTGSPGLCGPAGIAFDEEGNLWVSDDVTTVVIDGQAICTNLWKFAPDGSVTPFVSPIYFPNPNAIRFDSDWNLFVVCSGGSIYKISPDKTVSFIADSFLCPQSIAFDASGNIFTSDQPFGNIYKIDRASGSVSLFATIPGIGGNQGGLTFDGEGNLYASGPGDVYIVTPANEVKHFITGFAPWPRGLIFDKMGRLYITEYFTGIVWRVTKKIEADVDVDPNKLNLRSKGNWVTAYIELPRGYDAKDIDIRTVLLDGIIKAELKPVTIGDMNGNGIPDMMVKFDWASVKKHIRDDLGINKGEVTLRVTGDVAGATFEGTDTIGVTS